MVCKIFLQVISKGYSVGDLRGPGLTGRDLSKIGHVAKSESRSIVIDD